MRPRHIVGTLLVIIVALVCVRLGFWQLDRLQQKRDFDAALLSRTAMEPVDVAGLPATPEGSMYRRATATGTFDATGEVLLYGRARDGEPGNHVLTPLLLEDGIVLIVDRGWVPASVDAAPAIDAPPPAGTIEVEGILLPGEDGDAGPLGEHRLLKRVDLQRLDDDLSGDVLPVYLRITPSPQSDGSTLPDPQPVERLEEGPHLGYAIQWFVFAVIAIVGWIVLFRRDVHRTSEEHGNSTDPADRD